MDYFDRKERQQFESKFKELVEKTLALLHDFRCSISGFSLDEIYVEAFSLIFRIRRIMLESKHYLKYQDCGLVSGNEQWELQVQRSLDSVAFDLEHDFTKHAKIAIKDTCDFRADDTFSIYSMLDIIKQNIQDEDFVDEKYQFHSSIFAYAFGLRLLNNADKKLAWGENGILATIALIEESKSFWKEVQTSDTRNIIVYFTLLSFIEHLSFIISIPILSKARLSDEEKYSYYVIQENEYHLSEECKNKVEDFMLQNYPHNGDIFTSPTAEEVKTLFSKVNDEMRNTKLGKLRILSGNDPNVMAEKILTNTIQLNEIEEYFTYTAILKELEKRIVEMEPEIEKKGSVVPYLRFDSSKGNEIILVEQHVDKENVNPKHNLFSFSESTSGPELACYLAAMIAAKKYEFVSRKDFINSLKDTYPDIITDELAGKYLSRLNDALQNKEIGLVKDQGSLISFVQSLYKQSSKKENIKKLATTLFLEFKKK